MALVVLLALHVLGIGAGSWAHAHDAARAAGPTLRTSQVPEQQAPAPVEAEVCTLCHAAAVAPLPSAPGGGTLPAAVEVPTRAPAASPAAAARAVSPPARAPPVPV